MVPKLTMLLPCIALIISMHSCKRGSKESTASDQHPALPKIGIERGHPALAAALRNMLRKCQVDKLGFPRQCTDNATQVLYDSEQKAGLKETIRTYCMALHDVAPKIKALAAVQLNRHTRAKTIKDSADASTLSCLLGELKAVHPTYVTRTVAQTAGFMATALGKESDLIPMLQQAKSEVVRAMGYGALWANGRMRVMDQLLNVLKESKSVLVRAEIINGFFIGDPLNDDERAKVCEALLHLMAADADQLVAGAAAIRVAQACRDARDQVLEKAGSMIKKNTFTSRFVTAVGAVDGRHTNDRATQQQKKRAISILVQVLNTRKIGETVRASALRQIAELDAQAGLKHALKHLESESTKIRQAAERVKKQKGKSRKTK
jgi:hypothetical protein